MSLSHRLSGFIPGGMASRFTKPCLLFFVILGGPLSGCGRDAPPTIPDFVPPHKIAFVESTVPEPAGERLAPAITPPPRPRAQPKVVKAAPVVQATVAATPTPAPTAPAAPSIVGTWQVVEMIVQGKSQPMPAGMQMSFTFEASGTVAMSVGGGQMPQPMVRQGTYTLNDNQITLNMDKSSKTGTCTFEGDNKVTLDFTEAKMVLSR